jgi:outer membrane protein OmpA-like peptidoglycan-associated protein
VDRGLTRGRRRRTLRRCRGRPEVHILSRKSLVIPVSAGLLVFLVHDAWAQAPAPPPASTTTTAPAPTPAKADATVEAMRSAWQALQPREPLVLAPKRGRAAADAVEAVESALRADPKADVAARVGVASAAIDEAAKAVAAAESALQPAIQARAAARDADAPRLLPRPWKDAEAAFTVAAEKVEGGRADLATSFAADAKTRYDKMRFDALRSDALASVQVGMKKLEDESARRWVPRSYVRAQDAVAKAEQLLRTRGTIDDEVRSAVAAADLEVQHATFLLERMRRSCDGDPAQLESTILDWEASLDRTLTQAGIAHDPSRSLGPGLEALETRVLHLTREFAAERASSGTRGQEVATLRASVQALGDSVRVRDAEIAQLRRVRDRQARVERMYEAFDRSEGRVFQDGPDVVLRLSGLDFAPGTATLTPASGALLDKVAASLRGFPGARVVVEGHVDGQTAAANQVALSQQRAEAVRSELVARSGGQASHMTAVGFGAARPIAAETDAAGRAANQRIELVIAPVD